MHNKYDVVIIGSGLGGLVCGYILSKNGYKVAVFEQGSQPGGCLQTFTRKGVKFETGVHYIGSMNEGQTLHLFFKYLSLFQNIKLYPLDPEGFDIISYNNEQYKYATGYENFIETLSQKFPSEYNNIKLYTRKIREIVLSSPFHSINNSDESFQFNSNYATTKVSDFVAQITSDKILQNVLVGLVPLYSGIKEKTPLYVHAFIKDSNISGAYRIMGGSDKIANSLVNSIRSFGGEIFLSSKVREIVCNSVEAKCIVLENGTHVEANYFISNTHPEITVNMIDSHLIRPIFRNRIYQMEQTVAYFTVYLKFKENKVPYMNHNFYHYSGDEVWNCENYTTDDWPRGYLYMHLCPEQFSRYAQTGEIITIMNFEEVAQWAGTKVEQRGEAYKEFKKRRAEKLLLQIEAQFPGTLAQVEDYYTSTPLTYLNYTGTIKGSAYGVLRNVNTPRIVHRTRIPNLFFTGQNTNSHGIMGVIIGSVITCSELIGREFLWEQIKNCRL
ncbi:MAG: NAD(P)/FAD-dependent oxidoreductase [Bacteroidales bacterium]|jgi:all-trans-retinol 13,14-reductase|nr:NAD(P)/FAD-dependent oxidoreductase [Bacteroidales bacterium]